VLAARGKPSPPWAWVRPRYGPPAFTVTLIRNAGCTPRSCFLFGGDTQRCSVLREPRRRLLKMTGFHSAKRTCARAATGPTRESHHAGCRAGPLDRGPCRTCRKRNPAWSNEQTAMACKSPPTRLRLVPSRRQPIRPFGPAGRGGLCCCRGSTGSLLFYRRLPRIFGQSLFFPSSSGTLGLGDGLRRRFAVANFVNPLLPIGRNKGGTMRQGGR
jgi:hypothetical protein